MVYVTWPDICRSCHTIEVAEKEFVEICFHPRQRDVVEVVEVVRNQFRDVASAMVIEMAV